MTVVSRVELALICILSLACFLLVAQWPTSLALGRVVLYLALLFLLQTLIRDLWLLSQRKTRFDASKPAQPIFCIETTVGLIAVVIGCVLLFLPASNQVYLSALGGSLAVFLTLLSGLLLKDYVISWNPWRIYKDPDHINIVISKS